MRSQRLYEDIMSAAEATTYGGDEDLEEEEEEDVFEEEEEEVEPEVPMQEPSRNVSSSRNGSKRIEKRKVDDNKSKNCRNKKRVNIGNNPSTLQDCNNRGAEDHQTHTQDKKQKILNLTFEEACKSFDIKLPSLEEAKQALKPKVEQLKATLPNGISALSQIMKKMQELVIQLRDTEYESCAEMATYFVATQVLELDMMDTFQVVSNDNYQHLNDYDFTMLCVVVIASVEIKERLIKLSNYLQNNRFTNFIDCTEILLTAQNVHIATEDIQRTVSIVS